MGFLSLKETGEIMKKKKKHKLIWLTNDLYTLKKPKNLKRQNNRKYFRQLLLNKLYELIEKKKFQ